MYLVPADKYSAVPKKHSSSITEAPTQSLSSPSQPPQRKKKKKKAKNRYGTLTKNGLNIVKI